MKRPGDLLPGGQRGGGHGRAEASPATGDGGPAASSLTAGVGATHVPIFESSHPEGSYVGDLLSCSFSLVLMHSSPASDKDLLSTSYMPGE